MKLAAINGGEMKPKNQCHGEAAAGENGNGGESVIGGNEMSMAIWRKAGINERKRKPARRKCGGENLAAS